jgi:hypothetical protein
MDTAAKICIPEKQPSSRNRRFDPPLEETVDDLVARVRELEQKVYLLNQGMEKIVFLLGKKN